MTKWTITVYSHSSEDDSKVLQIMKYIGTKLGLGYTVNSKEASPEDNTPKPKREGGLVR